MCRLRRPHPVSQRHVSPLWLLHTSHMQERTLIDARALSETHCHLQCFGHPWPLYSTPTFDQSNARWWEDPLTPQWSPLHPQKSSGLASMAFLVLETPSCSLHLGHAPQGLRVRPKRTRPLRRGPGLSPGSSVEKPGPGRHCAPHIPGSVPWRMKRGSTSGTSGIRCFHAPTPEVRRSTDETDGTSAWCIPSCPTGGNCGCPPGAEPLCCGIQAASSPRGAPATGLNPRQTPVLTPKRSQTSPFRVWVAAPPPSSCCDPCSQSWRRRWGPSKKPWHHTVNRGPVSLGKKYSNSYRARALHHEADCGKISHRKETDCPWTTGQNTGKPPTNKTKRQMHPAQTYEKP